MALNAAPPTNTGIASGTLIDYTAIISGAGSVDYVNTAAEMTTAISAASPGDVIVIEAGTYSNWGSIDLGASGTVDGTSGSPIYVFAFAPASKTTIFNRSGGATRFKFTGDYWVLAGLYFDAMYWAASSGNTEIITAEAVTGCRVSDCTFYQCGHASYSNDSVFIIRNNCAGITVDHNTFDACINRSLRLYSYGAPLEAPYQTKIEYNLFQNHTSTVTSVLIDCVAGRPYPNSDATDGGYPAYSEFRYNEIKNCNRSIEDKGKGSTFEFNYIHSTGAMKTSRYNMRHGNDKVVRGNFFKNVRSGIGTAHGKAHQIYANIFDGCGYTSQACIQLPKWGNYYDGSNCNYYESTDGTIISHNTFVNCVGTFGVIRLGTALGATGSCTGSSSGLTDDLPPNITITNNILESSTSGVDLFKLDVTAAALSAVGTVPDYNVQYYTGGASTDYTGSNDVNAAPDLSASYSPNVSSPAIGAGTTTAFTEDYYGEGFATTPDCGAIQVTPVASVEMLNHTSSKAAVSAVRSATIWIDPWVLRLWRFCFA